MDTGCNPQNTSGKYKQRENFLESYEDAPKIKGEKKKLDRLQWVLADCLAEWGGRLSENPHTSVASSLTFSSQFKLLGESVGWVQHGGALTALCPHPAFPIYPVYDSIQFMPPTIYYQLLSECLRCPAAGLRCHLPFEISK